MARRQIDVMTFKDGLQDNYVLVLTSNSVERTAVNEIIQKRKPASIREPNQGCALGFIANQLVLHLTGESGGSGVASVGRLASSIFKNPLLPKPALVLLVGFCWGNPRLTGVGNIILAPVVYSLNLQRVISQTRRHVAIVYNSSLHIDESILHLLSKNFAPNLVGILSGPLGSLETFYSSETDRDELLSQHPEILGGEMEGYDFLPDCRNTPWLVLKTVSDTAGSRFSRDSQAAASRRSAQCLASLLEELGAEGCLANPEINASTAALIELIIGNTILVDVADISADALNDYLNDTIGPLLQMKLERYSSNLEYARAFPSTFCDLILKLTQNALRHGKANRVEVSFEETKIVIRDDAITSIRRRLKAAMVELGHGDLRNNDFWKVVALYCR
jgi:hypothetical protein